MKNFDKHWTFASLLPEKEVRQRQNELSYKKLDIETRAFYAEEIENFAIYDYEEFSVNGEDFKISIAYAMGRTGRNRQEPEENIIFWEMGRALMSAIVKIPK